MDTRARRLPAALAQGASLAGGRALRNSIQEYRMEMHELRRYPSAISSCFESIKQIEVKDELS